MAISARLQHVPAADRRSSPRRKLSLGSSLQAIGDAVTILDFSATGMLIETAAELLPFDAFQIDLPEVGFTQAVIIWNSGRYYGCELNEPLPQAAISAALLRSAPALTVDQLPLPIEPAARRSVATDVVEASALEDLRTYEAFEDDKAPLTVRLRVIFGSAIVLWSLILWAISRAF
jgi:PilZ domain